MLLRSNILLRRSFSTFGGYDYRGPSGIIPRSRLYAHGPVKTRRTRKDAPVRRPPEQDSASLNAWDAAVNILKRGSSAPPNPAYGIHGGLRIALLIDAENITYKNVDGIVNEVEKLGIVQIRRIYADWTSEVMRGWRQTVLTNALTPVHQFQSSSGKGNTDSMMIIDAMDILNKNKDIESFCIVSSDADFTRLATKLREEGKLVLGIGSNLTPAPFVVACNRFVYLHNLMKEDTAGQQQQQVSMQPSSQQYSQATARAPMPVPAQQTSAATGKPMPGKPTAVAPSQPTPITSAMKTKAKIDMTQREPKPMAPAAGEKVASNPELLRSVLPVLTRAWASYRQDNGWAPLEGVTAELERVSPGFSVSSYGPFMKLEELLEATDFFELKRPQRTTPYWQIRRVVRPRSATAPAGPPATPPTPA